jgi:hypothetical protein
MSSSASRGFQIEYPAITLHAVSRAASGPSVYLQLDETAGDPNAGGDDFSDMRELNIVPISVDSRAYYVLHCPHQHVLTRDI